MLFPMVHFCFPEAVNFAVEIAVDLLLLTSLRFYRLLFPPEKSFPKFILFDTMEFQIFTGLWALLFNSEIRLVDFSVPNFHGHGAGWCSKCSRGREQIHGPVLGTQ